MNRILTATAALAVAVPTTITAGVALAGSAAAEDVEKQGTCRAATFELTVDKGNGRFEVDADLDHTAPGTAWRLSLFHDGRRFVKVVRTADREGDIDLAERLRPDTAGTDTFRLKVKRIGGFAPCSVTVTTR